MNKTLLTMATIASLGLISTAQAAAPNEVTFIGAVSAKTCELVPEIDGAVHNMIDLGTIAPSALGTPVAFKFKAVDIANCASAAMETTMQWSGASLGATGLEMTGGAATGTTVLLASTGATATEITKTSDSAVFTAEEVKGGAGYTATLKAGDTAGNFRTAAAYSVSYK